MSRNKPKDTWQANPVDRRPVRGWPNEPKAWGIQLTFKQKDGLRYGMMVDPQSKPPKHLRFDSEAQAQRYLDGMKV